MHKIAETMVGQASTELKDVDHQEELLHNVVTAQKFSGAYVQLLICLPPKKMTIANVYIANTTHIKCT